MGATAVYRFGRCEVDPRARQVRLDGAVADSQPKAFDLLLYLIRHRDRVVDRDELFAQLWPGVVVSDAALTQALRKARAMVGDDGSSQQVIRTVQRRGFRFVAELTAIDAEDAEAMPRRTLATEAVAEPSVAVLPFSDMSPSQDQQYFCDGMTEEVISQLARTPGLRVAARTSVFALKNRPDDVREIGRRLGVTSIVEGSVRKAGDRLRVTAQLVDARSGFQL